jgi:iron complex outermembrane receptor protein
VSQFLLKDLGIPLVANPIGSKSFGKFTPKIALDWQVTRTNLVYVSYSQGFKAGGFTGRYTEPRAAVDGFAPETVTSYEVGVKNEFFDRHLRLNLAAYRADYRDIQIVVQENVTPLTRNAAKGRIQGFEVEATAVPLEGLELSYGLGFTDAKYLSITDPRAQITTANRFVDTPKWNMSGGVQYELDLGAHGSLLSRVDATYRTKVAKDAINTPQIVQHAYGTVNARITYRNPSKDLQLALFVTNLTDKAYLVSGFSSLPALGIVNGIYARPREWGLSLKKTF